MCARRVISGCVLVAISAAGWFFLAPTQLGGRTTYVTTHGVSMEPRFHSGDLAVLRRADAYRVGDVVGYRSAVMHTVVMHRIADISHGQYTFKGDNNPWIDPEKPIRARLIGSLVLRVPHGGIWIARALSPPGLGLLTLALLITGTTTAHTPRSRRRRGTVSRHAAPRTRLPRVSSRTLPPAFSAAPLVIVSVGLLGAATAAFAWTTPVRTPRTVRLPQTASLRFSYTAAVPKTAAYDGTTVDSPDPIFRKVTNAVDVHYVYRGQPAVIRTSARLTAGGGWHSSLPLAARVTVRGTRYVGSVRLNLRRLDARAAAAAAVTGIRVDQLALDVTADIERASGHFKANLPFTLTPLELSLRGDPKQLTVTHTTFRPNRIFVPRDIRLIGRELKIATARTISVVLLVGFIIAVTALAVAAGGRSGNSAANDIRRRYAKLLVPVHPVSSPPGRPVMDVDDFSTLLGIAEQYRLLILHWSRSGVDTFVVEDDGATFRYRVGSAAPVSGESGAVDAESPKAP